MSIQTLKSFTKNNCPTLSPENIETLLRDKGFMKTVQRTDKYHSNWKPADLALSVLNDFEGDIDYSEIIYQVRRTGKTFGQKVVIYYKD